MNFWQRLVSWLSGRSSQTSTEISTTATTPVSKPATGAGTGTSPKKLLLTYFHTKDKHTSAMLNSISLSSDMNTLFLIDNGRAIAYDLTQSQGVVIGLLADQLVVATATGFASDATDEPGGATSGDAGGGDGSATNTDRYVFSVEPKSQYSLTYNPTQKALGVIGTGDIVINMQGPSGNHDCQNPFISLDRGRIVRIRRVNNQLEITTVRS